MGYTKKYFKAIVIDDEKERNNTYEAVLGNNYDVTIINDINTISRKQVMKYDLLVIDICLSKNVDTLTAFKILKDYNLTLPTVLVSGEWVNEKGEPNEFILQVPSFKNVIKVIGWNDFNKEKNNLSISEEIFYEFCKFKNIAMGNEKDKCLILHISDSQFGGNVSGSACNDNNRIANYLKENNLEPDLLFITGDIADKGKKEEFNQAQIWIEEFMKKIWDVDDLTCKERDKIILVPGNHDYDLSINASELFEFKFAANAKDTFEKRKNVKKYVNQKLGFQNYIEFAYKLTGDIEWLKYLEKPLHINNKFINFGINIYTLNSVHNINNRNCENRFDEFYCDLTQIKEKEFSVDEEAKDVFCNILIMHNPPEDFRRGTSNGEKSWNMMQTLIQDNKINLCFYGHTHDFRNAYHLRDNGGLYCKKLLCIPAPSVRLDAASRTDDACRGFNIVELYKEDGVIKKVKPRYFKMEKANISEYDNENEEYEILII